MPTYNYVCPACGAVQEITKPISESSREEPCGGRVTDAGYVACDGILVRDFNGQASTFKLNGSGWTGNSLTKGRRK